MSTDGILEYQGTKRVLYRGDTSNIVFDTRTTSLGIGVTGSNNPSSNLYITGNAYVSSNLAIGGVMTMGVVNVAARHNLQAVTDMGNVTTHTIEFTNPTTSLVASGNVEVGTANLFVDTTHSRVGIGTTSPLVTLDTHGNMRSSAPYPRFDFYTTTNRSTNAWGNSTDNAGDYRIYSNGDASDGTKRSLNFDYGQNSTHTTRMAINANGNVGIATTSPVATLHINGSLYNTAKIELLKRLVTITGGYNQLHPLQPGMQLYASDARNTWQQYQFASDSEWLIGTLGSDMVNGGSGTDSDMTISVKADVTAFLIRHTSGWSGVSTTGWSSIGTVAALMTGYTNNFEIWARTFSQGTHSMNTYSAMYAFTI